jgi:hypothetical protein
VQCAYVVADVQSTGGSDAGENSFFIFVGCHDVV